LRVRNNLLNDEELKYRAECARDEQILVFSCCIDKLWLRIRDEEDKEKKLHLVNLLNLLCLSLASLEKQN